MLAAVMLLPLSARAQQESLVNTSHHELRLTVGALIDGDSFFGIAGWNGFYNSCPNAFHPETYDGNLYGTPVLSLSYHYQVKRWFSLGVAASFHTEYQRSYYFINDAPIYKDRSTYFAITPIARFDWFRWDFIKLYSSIGLGFGLNVDKGHSYDSNQSYKEKEIGVTLDIVPMGITMGRKVYGFAEVGVGSLGFLRAGIGYRFADKKK